MKLLPNLFAKRPHIAEHDFSGVIVNSNGTEFSNGDAVYGWIPFGEFIHCHKLKFTVITPLHQNYNPRHVKVLWQNTSACQLTTSFFDLQILRQSKLQASP
jgi:hypothetical protein